MKNYSDYFILIEFKYSKSGIKKTNPKDRNIFMKWDLIIFDCDGVLVDSEAIGNRFIAEALTSAIK